MTAPELRELYPELAGRTLVEVDVVTDAETLESIPDESQDFVVANHVIEHMENTVRALGHWLRVLRPGGVLFMAVPHRERTFDRHRPGTPVEAVLADYRDGPGASRRGHYVEWVEKVEGVTGAAVEAAVETHMRDRFSIHFHTWTDSEFLELLRVCSVDLGLPLGQVECTPNGEEFIVTARKRY